MKKKLIISSLSVLMLFACNKLKLQPNDNNTLSSGTVENTGATISSTVYTAGLDPENNILLNALGYNPRNYILTEPYSQPHETNIQLGLVNSKANIIRYPGGTFANYWDYANDRMFQSSSTKAAGGWVNPVKVHADPTDAIRVRIENGITAPNGNGILVNSVNDLKYAAKGGTSGQVLNVVFHMNMVTPGYDYYKTIHPNWAAPNPGTSNLNDTWYKMLDDRYARFKAMLLRAKSGTDPITIRFIELGNEYYFDLAYCVEAFQNGAAHGTASNYIANKLLSDTQLNLTSNLKIAATASCKPGGNTRKSNWNNSLKSTLDKNKVGYVTMHSYEAFVEPAPGNWNESNFQTQLVDWIEKVNKKFIDSYADAFIQAANPWKIWYTENNANWDGGFDGDPSGEKEWGQNLVEAYSVVHLYERGNATMNLQFQFNNQVIDAQGNLYNRALALKPFMEAAKDATSAARINFGGTDMPKLPGNVKAVVQGYLFKTSTGTPHCVLINLSATNKHVNLGANIFTTPETLQKVGYKNDLNSIDPAIIISTTDTRSDVTLPPYSVIHFYQ